MAAYVLIIIAIVGVILLWKKFRKGGCCLGSILKGLFVISLSLLGITLVIGIGVSIFEGIEERNETKKQEQAEQLVDAFLEDLNYPFYLDRDELVELVKEDPDLLEAYRDSLENGNLDDIYNNYSKSDPEEEESTFWSFIGEAFTFYFEWWVLLPIGIGVLIAVIGCSKFSMKGDTATSVMVYGCFISVVLLVILNWLLILSMVTVVAILAAIGLTVGYLLPPVFKELPTLLYQNSEPKNLGEEDADNA